jgi:hypothetical protein
MAQPASRARRCGTRQTDTTKYRRGVELMRPEHAKIRREVPASKRDEKVGARRRQRRSLSARSYFRRGVDGVSTGRETREGEREKRGRKGGGGSWRGCGPPPAQHPPFRGPQRFVPPSQSRAPSLALVPQHCCVVRPATGQPPSRSDLMDAECKNGKGGGSTGENINNVVATRTGLSLRSP